MKSAQMIAQSLVLLTLPEDIFELNSKHFFLKKSVTHLVYVVTTLLWLLG